MHREDEQEAGEGEEEEEVEVDEEGTEEQQNEEVALMQAHRGQGVGKPTPKEEAWKPLTATEKGRLAGVIRALLEFQTTVEPSLALLASIEAPPVMCGCNPDSDDERDFAVSFGELRPAIIRWLRSTPRHHAPTALEVVMGIPGRTHPEPATMQSIARQLQAEVQTAYDPLLDQVLRSWADSTDIGIVEEALKMAMEGYRKGPVQQALSRFRNRIAVLYNQLEQAVAPQTIVTMRVSLRERKNKEVPDRNGTQGQIAASSSSGETEKESSGAGIDSQVGSRPRRVKKRRVQKYRKVQLTPEDIAELSTIPRTRRARAAAPNTREQEVQTLSRRRQGISGAKPKTEAQLHHELHGDEQNGHSSRDTSPAPTSTRTLSQTSKRRRVRTCDVEENPEREIEAFRIWISPEASRRLEAQQRPQQLLQGQRRIEERNMWSKARRPGARHKHPRREAD